MAKDDTQDLLDPTPAKETTTPVEVQQNALVDTQAQQERSPQEQRATEAPPVVVPTGPLVNYVQSDDGIVRVHVLSSAQDGSLTLLVLRADGTRAELAGVAHDADGAPGTWHEVEV